MGTRPRLRHPKALIAGLGAFALTAAFFAAPSNVVSRSLLALEGRQTSGIVVRKEPANHRALIYTYDVNGRQFEGAGIAGPSTGPFEQVALGQTITVVYLPAEPTNSTLIDSVGDVRYTIGFITFVSILSGVSVAWRLARLRDGRQS